MIRMMRMHMFTIAFTPPDLWGRHSEPATITHSDGRVYTFLGGYGNEACRPTQDGCELIIRLLDRQGVCETDMAITDVLTAARRAYDPEYRG